MDTPLLTEDGFPRSDIDVAQVRMTRARIIRLRNDYRALLGELELALHDHHAALRTLGPAAGSATAAAAAPVVEVPFAVVNDVSHSSPAFEAGLVRGDRIIHFGSVHAGNHRRLAELAAVVQANVGSPIAIDLVRNVTETGIDTRMRLRLVPRRDWGGKGMLGCHILPL
ncbi:uncharacterized protein V1510DRAFT_401500 [Dipodascopsis tothii]|uniref:uncharacterized protein n=1 Tax=Dipodascopsis tothii TaxID=44089 RepID=UPI0034CD7AE2